MRSFFQKIRLDLSALVLLVITWLLSSALKTANLWISKCSSGPWKFGSVMLRCKRMVVLISLCRWFTVPMQVLCQIASKETATWSRSSSLSHPHSLFWHSKTLPSSGNLERSQPKINQSSDGKSSTRLITNTLRPTAIPPISFKSKRVSKCD